MPAEQRLARHAIGRASASSRQPMSRSVIVPIVDSRGLIGEGECTVDAASRATIMLESRGRTVGAVVDAVPPLTPTLSPAPRGEGEFTPLPLPLAAERG
jgi:L-alanine-DL-glutamate epimerase-like enolase superfamily enzyme